ncbi:polyadenylation and cleavage factor homolog 4-like [Phragmites australis]|uniref:polyadenylation and cleavage factor homolog 4-like n=1 Tax=Phragmites australis TaxID=29695 RepID=UPI002D778643|nr:polyadenylation and cleavage factor homolog 4-like [Phragmites australis]
MAGAAAGQVLERFRARLREEAGGEPGAAAVVCVYAEALRDLTFNCKPVITELTIIAGQHAALAARGIADAVCARVAEVPPDQILPSLYLLDSIVKNIGQEYVEHFAVRLQKVFCDAYCRVHPNQYASMRHLFRTWWPVFPSSVLRGIEDDLQFSPSENKRPATAANLRQSESLSPRLSHGIHVNPKYLEAQQKFKQATAVHQPAAHATRQVADVEEDQINGLTSYGSRGRPPSKLQKMQYADDPDQQETFRSLTGMIRATPPHLLSTHPSYVNPDGPLTNSRRNLSRSPPLDVLPRNVPPKRALERLPPSHSVLGPDPRRLPDRNGRSRWAFDDGAQRPTISMLDEEYRKQSARELIDAYGNCQGRDADERFTKMQRLDSNGMANKSSAQNWLTSEEEEYSWEDMSPTLTDRIRSSMPSLPPTGTMRAGFPGANAGLLESDIGRHSFPNQAPRSSVDGPPLNLEDRITATGHVDMSTSSRYPSNFGVQNEALLEYQSSEHTIDHGRIPTMPAPPWQQPTGLPLRVQAPEHSSVLNRILQPADGEMPAKRFAIGGTYDTLNVDIPLLERRRSSSASAPIEWPHSHHTQSQTLPPMPPDTKHVRSATDSLEIRPFSSQGVSSSVFVPRHQYDALDRKTVSTGGLAQPPSQQPDLLSSSQQNEATILGNQAQPHRPLQFHPHPHQQESFRSFAPGMSVSPFQGQGGGAAPPVPFLPNSFSVPPSVPPYGVPSTPSFPLPPLPPGPPPAPLQMGPSSQVGGPQPFVSGLLSNLMKQGVISLEPPSQPEDSVGVDFSIDLKVRNESVINALYQDLPRQCKTCGLRFKCQEEHRAHMDWHVTKNRNSKNRKQSSRKYYVTAEEWLRAAETVGNDGVPAFVASDPDTDRKEEKEVAVPADEEQTVCALCQETFEDFYSDETEEWMYKGAVYMNAPDGNIDGLERPQLGPIIHAKCRSGPSNIS